MKARIYNNEFQGVYTEDFINANFNNVINGVLVSEWELTELMPSDKLINPLWDGSKWTEGATDSEIIEKERALLPKCVSQRQIRTQLVLNGFNLNDIQLAINELSEPDKSIAQIAWDYAITFERDSPLLICLAANLGLTQAQVDEIFLNASKL